MDKKRLLRKAQRLLAGGSARSACELVQEYLNAHEAEPELLHFLARVRMLEGCASDAVPLLQEALRLHSERSPVSRSTGQGLHTLQPTHGNLRSAPVHGEDIVDEDWDLIRATAAENESRRRYFQPEIDLPDQYCMPGARGLSRQDKHLATDIPTEPEDEWPDEDIDDRLQLDLEGDLGAPADLDALAEVEDEGLDDDLEPDVDYKISVGLPDPDWTDLDLDADEYDDLLTRAELPAVTTEDELERRERAQQEAIKLGLEFDWDEAGIALLTEVFDRYWWSKAKVSMRRELQAGMQPEELRLALALRDMWTDNPEFAMDFSGLYSDSPTGATSAVYRNLSWPMALKLVRSTEGYPEVEELEALLLELFDEWYADTSSHRVFKSFNLFVFFRFGMADQQLQEWPRWSFCPDEGLGLELEDNYQPGIATSEYRLLNALGLLPHPRDHQGEFLPETLAHLS